MMNTKAFFYAAFGAVLLYLPAIFSTFGKSGSFVVGAAGDLINVPNIEIKEQSEIDLQALLARYELLHPSPKPKPEPKELSAEELAKLKAATEQQIDKTLLPNFQRFDDSHQISLVGIFDADELFVVVELLNYQSRESQYKKVLLKDKLSAYELTQINKKSVLFAREQNTLELKLFR